ncbi:hypothetical protein QR680_007779 [Steinernema hermaphroditum]|uniref:SXP/RAL-2 family protein Ani s 5-like cation-binding domain-containing protein n=1 Tax=Steinernema hermaphroditum TaxID=289476 RepID=A0AA39M6Y2_9BILA|nr:hypothetical protein QR680_007779 [Steinernema hermaphroditum]
MFHIDFWVRFAFAVGFVATTPILGAPNIIQGTPYVPTVASNGVVSYERGPVISFLQSDRYEQFKRYDSYAVPDTLNKKQAEQHLKEWINKQSPQDKERFLKDLNDIDTLYRNLNVIVNKSVSSLSKEAQGYIKEMQRFSNDESLTLRQQREGKLNLFTYTSNPTTPEELVQFSQKVANDYVQQFGEPVIAGKSVFGGKNWGNGGNSWGNGNGEWGQRGGNSGTDGWGQIGNNGYPSGNQKGWGNGGNSWGGSGNGWGQNGGNSGSNGWGQNGGNSGNSGWGQNGVNDGWGNPSGNQNSNGGWGSGGNSGWGQNGGNSGGNGWGQNNGNGWGKGAPSGGQSGWGNENGWGGASGNQNSGGWGTPSANSGWNFSPSRVPIGKGVEVEKKVRVIFTET